MLYMLSVRRRWVYAIEDIDKMNRAGPKPMANVVVINPEPGAFSIIDQSAQTQGQFELLQEAKGEIENLGPNLASSAAASKIHPAAPSPAQQNLGMNRTQLCVRAHARMEAEGLSRIGAESVSSGRIERYILHHRRPGRLPSFCRSTAFMRTKNLPRPHLLKRHRDGRCDPSTKPRDTVTMREEMPQT